VIFEGNSISGIVIFCRDERVEVTFLQSGNKSTTVNGANAVVVPVIAVRVAVTTSTTVTVALPVSSVGAGVGILDANSVRNTVVVLVVEGMVSVVSVVTNIEETLFASN
jgi:hypothetical protein